MPLNENIPIKIFCVRHWEGVLSKDMATVGEYLQTLKLKLSKNGIGSLPP